MNAFALELAGKGQCWNLNRPEIRMGRDPGCDIVFAEREYPMVSRHHLLLRIEGDRLLMEDLNSTHGTFLNGKRLHRAEVAVNDVLRLAADGPELRVHAGPLAHAMVLAGVAGDMAATRVAPFAAPAPAAATRIGTPGAIPPVGATRVALGGASGGVAPTRVAPAAQHPPAAETIMGPAQPLQPSVTGPTPAEAPLSAGPPPVSPAEPSAQGVSRAQLVPEVPQPSPMDPQLMEQKLNALRNLLIVTVILGLVLAGLAIHQSRMIDRNRQELSNMKKDAVENLMPTLDRRLKEFDARLSNAQSMMEGMDGKMRQAEDRFVQRMNRELPKIIDRYVEQKAKELQQKTGPIPR
jgi:hypothetical protein